MERVEREIKEDPLDLDSPTVPGTQWRGHEARHLNRAILMLKAWKILGGSPVFRPQWNPKKLPCGDAGIQEDRPSIQSCLTSLFLSGPQGAAQSGRPFSSLS